MNKILTQCKKLFYPVLKCPICKQFNEGLCIRCEDALTFYDRVPSLDRADGISLYSYNQAANDLISCYKKKKEFSAGETMVKLMVDRAGLEMKKAQLITCAPSSLASIKRLGFDHGEFLIKLISKEIEVPSSLVFQPSKTIQKGLTKEERTINAMGINFRKYGKEQCRGKAILIIDDVFTTGSTMNRCLSLLRMEGVEAKYITFSRL